MNIGIVGSGNIGGTLAQLLSEAGHQVALSNSRGPDSLRSQVAALGPNVQAATQADAIAFGEVVVLAIPYHAVTQLPPAAFDGKIVVDAGNYFPPRGGQAAPAAEATILLTARHLPGARVVKSFNTIWFQHLAQQGDRSKPPEARRVVFVAADDEAAKRTVLQLVDELGFGALDAGSLAESTRLEPGSAVYNQDITMAEARQLLERPA